MPDPRYLTEARRLLETATLEEADIETVRLLLGRIISEMRADPRRHWGTPLALKAYTFLLYAAGNVADAPLAWQAKRLNFDTQYSIDILWCAVAGPEATIAWLKQHLGAKPELAEMIDYMEKSLVAGDFENQLWDMTKAKYIDETRALLLEEIDEQA